MIILGYFQKIQIQNFEIGLPAADIDKDRPASKLPFALSISSYYLCVGDTKKQTQPTQHTFLSILINFLSQHQDFFNV